MPGSSAVTIALGSLFTLLLIPYAVSSPMTINAPWKQPRKHHCQKWISLGTYDGVTASFVTRGFGGMTKTLEVLKNVDDEALQEILSRLKRHERFAARYLLPLFAILLVSCIASGVN